MTKSKRYSHIDLLECVGIFLVVLYHSTTYKYDWMQTRSIVDFSRYFMRTILSTCVPIFFFANGYLLLNTNCDLKKHIYKSIKMVALAFVWGLIGILAIMPLEGESFSLKEICNNLWHWQPIGWINHMWYIGALICIYIFFPLLKNAFDNNRKVFIYFTIICAILTLGNTLLCQIGSVFADIFFEKNTVYFVNVFNIFNPFREIFGYSFVYFCIGGLAAEYKPKLEHISQKKRNIVSLITIIICCTLSTTMWAFISIKIGHIWDVVWSGYDTIFTLITLVAVFVLSLSYTADNSIIQTISTNTLGIFFIHYIIIHLTRNHVIKFAFMRTFTGNIFYAFGIIFISLGITLLLKQLPVINKLVKI